MKRITRLISSTCMLTSLLISVAGCSKQEGDFYTEGSNTYKLYFLGGQSNMDGYGYVAELPDELRMPVDRVMIFKGHSALDDNDGGEGVWAPLQPGFGRGAETDGKTIRLSDRFGPELTFGLSLSSDQPGTRIALIKYSLGGSGLAPGIGYGSWHPTNRNGKNVNQYDHALNTIRNALGEADIDSDGAPDRLVPSGIIWMQGESDANQSQKVADAYKGNLTRLMQFLRAAMGVDSLPIVIGKITDSGMAEDGTVMDYIATVQTAQSAFADEDKCARLVSVTDELIYRDDAWHYDTDGFIRLGSAFAEASLELEKTCP